MQPYGPVRQRLTSYYSTPISQEIQLLPTKCAEASAFLAQAHVLRMCGMSVVCETIYSHKHRRSLSAKRRSVLLLRVWLES